MKFWDYTAQDLDNFYKYLPLLFRFFLCYIHVELFLSSFKMNTILDQESLIFYFIYIYLS